MLLKYHVIVYFYWLNLNLKSLEVLVVYNNSGTLMKYTLNDKQKRKNGFLKWEVVLTSDTMVIK